MIRSFVINKLLGGECNNIDNDFIKNNVLIGGRKNKRKKKKKSKKKKK